MFDKKLKKALIVDDDPVNRKLLKAILQRENYQPLLAENGLEAVEAFEVEKPDIVLMDIMMPLMNGYEAARRIKEISSDRFTPIIFLTAVTDEEALSRCVEAGGDDFLTKPYNRIILKAKINAMERIRSLYATLNRQRLELQTYRSEIQHELEFAEHIFRNITSKGTLDLPYLRYYTSSMSMSMFNGDIVLAVRKPNGGALVMLCDFTGHGLPAAVGALPVSEVFVAMAERGFSINDIASEMNRKLRQELPTGFFCAAALVDVDATRCTLSVWNGGLPSILLIDGNGKIKHQIPSRNLPLGITDKPSISEEVTVTEITPGLRAFMYTDGLIEAVNQENEMFGLHRLVESIEGIRPEQRLFDRVTAEVDRFRGQADQNDDISFVELSCYEAMNDLPDVGEAGGQERLIPAEWKINLDLSGPMLNAINPVPLLLNYLNQIRIPGNHRRRIHTILTELYNNAVDHGLLELDSRMKNTSEGFAAYYSERQKRLGSIQNGRATITLNQTMENGEYILKMRICDSGSGFDYTAQTQMAEQERHATKSGRPSGRGIRLVKTLCRELRFEDNGATAEVVYDLSEDLERQNDAMP